MRNIRFEWDEAKNRSNQRKHGISFEEAAEVFADPLHMVVADRVEGGEQRWQAFGIVRGMAILMVAHTIWDEHAEQQTIEVIRIISARPANRRERQRYEDGNG